jgi:hypothetical protein
MNGVLINNHIENDQQVLLNQWTQQLTYNQYEMGSELLYLIRPDGYIASRNQPADSERPLNYLRNIFI